MLCLGFVIGLVVLIRRRGRGETLLVPAVVTALGLARLVLLAVTVVLLVGTFRAIGAASPEQRPAILQQASSEAMKPGLFGAAWDVPLLLVAWLVDRQLRQRASSRRPPAERAPDGATCGAHPEEAASFVCARCGAFLCAACLSVDGSRCGACAARTVA